MRARRAWSSFTLAALVLLPTGVLAQSDNDFLDSYFESAVASETAPESGSVAILWEANSYAPPTYEGRRLASAESTVSLWAIPHFSGAYSTEQLTYTWKLNGATLLAQSGKGRAAITINAPELFGSYTVSVEVSSADLAARATESVRIASVEPIAHLYAEHPLFGLQYWSAIGNNAFIPEREMVFAAIPFFAPVALPDEAALRWSWRIDRKKVASNPIRPSTVTVSAGEGGAVATLDVVISHASHFFLESRGAWQVTLGAGAGAGAGVFDPFRTNPL